MDKREMRGLLTQMEAIAEQILQHDAAFFEALQALKWEIDTDNGVKSAVCDLRAAGHRVFSSFVPRIRVRIKTESGTFALAASPETRAASAPEPVAQMTQQLKTAATAVIATSRHCQELERIVNEAVTSSETFEELASQIENAGCEVLISVDLSAYAQVQPSFVEGETNVGGEAKGRSNRQASGKQQNSPMELSSYDLTFLKTMKIKTDENLPF